MVKTQNAFTPHIKISVRMCNLALAAFLIRFFQTGQIYEVRRNIQIYIRKQKHHILDSIARMDAVQDQPHSSKIIAVYHRDDNKYNNMAAVLSCKYNLTMCAARGTRGLHALSLNARFDLYLIVFACLLYMMCIYSYVCERARFNRCAKYK